MNESQIIEQLLAVIDDVLPEPLTDRKRARLRTRLTTVIEGRTTAVACAVVDAMRERGLIVQALDCASDGGVKMSLYPEPATPAAADVDADDPWSAGG